MFYYGATKTGKRIHLGDFVMTQRGASDWVETFCGVMMDSWEEGEQPPGSRVTDFCRNCFRTYAWQIMVDSLGNLATNSSHINQLEDFLAEAQLRRWTADTVVGQLRQLTERIKAHELVVLIPPARQEPIRIRKESAS